MTPSSEDLEDEDNGELDEEYDTLQDQDSDTDYNQVISMDLGEEHHPAPSSCVVPVYTHCSLLWCV